MEGVPVAGAGTQPSPTGWPSVPAGPTDQPDGAALTGPAPDPTPAPTPDPAPAPTFAAAGAAAPTPAPTPAPDDEGTGESPAAPTPSLVTGPAQVSEAPSAQGAPAAGRDEPLASGAPPPQQPPEGKEAEPAHLSPAAPETKQRDSRIPRRGLPTAPLIALLITTALMAAVTAFVWYQVRQHAATETARQAGLEASRDAARVLFSYDYRTLGKDFSAGQALTTGAFRKQYADTTARLVTPVATEKKAVVKAEVVIAGVVRATPDTVVTIVFVNQVTTSSLTAGPKVDLSRVRMTLQHVQGRWLVSQVDAL